MGEGLDYAGLRMRHRHTGTRICLIVSPLGRVKVVVDPRVPEDHALSQHRPGSPILVTLPRKTELPRRLIGG